MPVRCGVERLGDLPPPVSWERMLSAVRCGWRGLRPGRRGAGTGGGAGEEGVDRRAEARLLATMALAREARLRLLFVDM